MATRYIDQVNKNLEQRAKAIDASTNRVGANFPLVESSMDIITPLMPYEFEFYTYTKSPSVYLNITILEKFKVQL